MADIFDKIDIFDKVAEPIVPGIERIGGMPDAGAAPKVDMQPATQEFPGVGDALSHAWSSGLKEAVGEWWKKVSPVQQLQGLAQVAQNPPRAIEGMLAGQGDLAGKSLEAFKSGDYLGGIRHALNYAIPLLGQEIDEAGNLIDKGEIAKGVGQTLGIATNIAQPAIAGKIKNIPVGLSMKNPSAVKQAAAEWAEKQGIPLSAGTVTDNPIVKGTEKMAGSSPLGSMVDVAHRKALGEALTTTGENLAKRASPSGGMVAEAAGEAARGELESAITDLRKGTSAEYAPFDAAVRNPANKVTVQIGSQQKPTGVLDAQGQPIMTTVPITKDVVMPVDMRPYKQQLQPLYERMKIGLQPAVRDMSQGFQAVKSIVEGEDYLPARVVEDELGALKSVVREAEHPDAKDFGQGVAAKLIPKLQNDVDTAVGNIAGPKALQALQRGRKVASVKADAVETLKQLKDEPVELFNQLTYAHDAGINRLRDVALYTPKAMPKVGRAYIQKLMDIATQEGGFTKQGTVFNKWQALGPETKKLLFPDESLVKDLDNFFQTAKMAAEHPNPSGTALTLHGNLSTGGAIGGAITGGVTGGVPGFLLGAGLGTGYLLTQQGLAKLLHSPTGVRLLTKGLKIPLGNTVASTAIASQILKMVGDDARKLEPDEVEALKKNR